MRYFSSLWDVCSLDSWSGREPAEAFSGKKCQDVAAFPAYVTLWSMVCRVVPARDALLTLLATVFGALAPFSCTMLAIAQVFNIQLLHSSQAHQPDNNGSQIFAHCFNLCFHPHRLQRESRTSFTKTIACSISTCLRLRSICDPFFNVANTLSFTIVLPCTSLAKHFSQYARGVVIHLPKFLERAMESIQMWLQVVEFLLPFFSVKGGSWAHSANGSY